MKLSTLVHRLGYANELDLLEHFPRRYEDRNRWLNPFSLKHGDAVTCMGRVVTSKLNRWRGRQAVLEVSLQPQGEYQTLKLVWYNIPYLKKTFEQGKHFIVFGKIQHIKKDIVIYHPEFEAVTEGDEHVHLGRITPIYPTCEGVAQRVLRRSLFEHLPQFLENLEEWYPLRAGAVELKQAYRGIHFPESDEELKLSRDRLVFDELLKIQLILALRKASIQRALRQRDMPVHSLVKEFLNALPFQLTSSQLKVLKEIEEDLEKPHPMNRLLQGDVGSGKTLVAVCALLRCLESGKNGVLLAPTEILAEQHSLNLKRWLTPLGVDVQLWTGSKKPQSSEGTLFASKGTIFVGTHALIQESVSLPNIGLGVVDEQHKFGVAQRGALQNKAKSMDLLVMTATPIPRTLCLVLYGDLDVSILNEMPSGRGTIRTFLRKDEDLPKIYDFMKREFEQGRQAYVVCPLIDDSEKMELKSVQQEVKKLREVFGHDAVEMLHGKMSSEEKDQLMMRFRQKEFHLLVSTTVIEVGVDVPNATVMLVQNAERFGLSQLHQLRGRIGRGQHASYCILLSNITTEESYARLRVMETTLDGFQLAEEDFKLRGPGDVLGTEQSGMPPLKLADLHRDFHLLKEAREYAQSLIDKDPTLSRWQKLKEKCLAWETKALPVTN